jgi:hypothetical protein
MESLTELIKHTPEILKAASANDLALAVFFFLVGAVLVFQLPRNANSVGKLLAIIIWFGASLVALLYFVHQKMPEASYVTRILGQDTEVEGRSVDLDLGYVVTDVPHEYRLNVRMESDAATLEIRGTDAPLNAEISAATNREGKATDGGQILTIKLASPVTEGRRTSIVHVSNAGSKEPGLTLRVFYMALKSPVSVHADSGPKPSERGQDSSQNYTLCAEAPAQGDYQIDGQPNYSLTGDRACNAYSQCAPAPGTSAREACFVFNMQGHSECTGLLSRCEATRNSEGHIDATFKLVPSPPRLTAAAG